MSRFSKLLAVTRRFEFKPHRIGHLIDSTGRYDERLDREFPFMIRLFHFRTRRFTHGSTWHERLELFMPVQGQCPFRVGEHTLVLHPGDMVVLDNAKLHHVVENDRLDSKVVVVSFLPEFVYSLGSPTHDYAFLLPFYATGDPQPHLLRHQDDWAPLVYESLARLLEVYFDPAQTQYRQAACKAYLLEILYFLARHFHSAVVLQSEFSLQQQRITRLQKLFDYLSANYAEKITLHQAAAMTHLSKPQFTRVFKKVAGMTFVNYLTHTRISHAARLLLESQSSIAEIATQVGFSDQSYLTRQFRKSFGCSPRDYRKNCLRP